MKKLSDLIKKSAKEGKILPKECKQAKCEMLDELDKVTKGAIGDKLQKITVAAPTVEGLKKGLEAALEKVEDMSDEDESEEESEEKEEESEEKEPSEKVMALKKKLEELKG